MANSRRITHFISFSGVIVPATAENYRLDAPKYTAIVHRHIASAMTAANEHDRLAYALQAGMYARNAYRSAMTADRLESR